MKERERERANRKFEEKVFLEFLKTCAHHKHALMCTFLNVHELRIS